jgi:hypothetical protein
MGGSWVLFFISDNQEIQHGSPGVLGLIFYNGQPRNPTWESILYFIMDNQEEIQHGCPGLLGFIFYNGQPMNPHGELDFFFFNGQQRILRCTGFYYL